MTIPDRIPRVGIGCLVTFEGRLLLMRRKQAHGEGTWSTPGGHLDFGESPGDCAVREVREETGIAMPPMTFACVTNDLFFDGTTLRKHYITVWMRGEAPGAGYGPCDPDEVAECGWFTLDDLPSPLFVSLANLLAGRSLPPVMVSARE